MSPTEKDLLDIKAQSESNLFHDPRLALKLAKQVLAIARRIGTPRALAIGHLAVANAHAFSDDLNRVRQSLLHFKRAGERFDAANDYHGKARLQISYVYALSQLDHTEQAIAVAIEARRVLREVNDFDGLSRLLLNLGAAHDIQGEFEKALATYDQRLLLLETFVEDASEIGCTQINRAVAFLGLNEYAEAEHALELARNELVKDQMTNAAELAKQQLIIGIARAAQRQYVVAIPAFEQAIDLFEHLGQASQVSLARLYQALAQVNSGEILLVGAGRTTLESLMPELEHFGQREECGLARLGIVRAHIFSENWIKAQESLEKTLSSMLNPDSMTLRVQMCLLAADIAENAGNFQKAQQELQDAVVLIDEHEGDVGDDFLRASWFSDKRAPFFRLLRLAWMQGDFPAALEIAQRAKARELRRSLDMEAAALTTRVASIEPSLAQEINGLRQELGSKRRQARVDRWKRELTSMSAPSAGEDPKHIWTLEEKLRRAIGRAHQTVDSGSPSIRNWSAAELTTALKPNELLIEYLWGEDCIWAWAVSQEGVVSHHVISDVPMVGAACDSYAQAVRRALAQWDMPLASRLAPKLIASANEAGGTLFERLVAPFSQILSERKFDTLIFAGDGKLTQLPFHAFPTPDKGYLLDRYIIRYVAGVALAQPCIHLSRMDAIGVTGAIEHAENALLELNALGTCFTSVQKMGEDSNDDIGWARLTQAMSASHWIHIATHAEVHPYNPALSSFALGGRNVTLAEVAELGLTGSCVVLSACDTGRGHIRGSDVFSLARAFLMAGASTLITSLWPVGDALTAKLMQQFYSNLTLGQTTAQALRDAQLSLCRNPADALAAHPAFWAPMIVLGTDVVLKS